jgi:C4-dicarboxylate-specific signal transduction histidine kinase
MAVCESQPVGDGLANENDARLILVVEDDAALLKLIEKRLRASGFHAVIAKDGASALDWLNRDSPDLMLLDYSLPDMRGEQLIEHLHAQGRNIPFVVATGHGNERVAVEMMKRGAIDYLVKNATFMELLPTVVAKAIARAEMAQRLVEAKEQLREAHEDLEIRVQQRTAELAEANRRLRLEIDERRRAEDQVQQHQAELAHVTRLSTIGEMAIELTHELNQPLGAISSYAQACHRFVRFDHPNAKEELLNSLGHIGEQADRAAEIVRRLRRFVTKAKPMQTSVDLNAIIREVIELVDLEVRMTQTEIRLTLTEPLQPVVVDRIQIEQVLVNLIRNAFDALRDTPHEDRQLAFSTTVVDGHIRVDIADSGRGIPPEMTSHVFDRFFTTKADGMGMGLPISQSIITNHGGTLWFTLNSDRGCTFHFTLPTDPGEHHRGN